MTTTAGSVIVLFGAFGKDLTDLFFFCSPDMQDHSYGTDITEIVAYDTHGTKTVHTPGSEQFTVGYTWLQHADFRDYTLIRNIGGFFWVNVRELLNRS